ncbi:MAG: S41 family peptidase [Caldilineaceae bacterium]|nr:S41 family peptidase [Caldilineaceae bacterium]
MKGVLKVSLVVVLIVTIALGSFSAGVLLGNPAVVAAQSSWYRAQSLTGDGQPEEFAVFWQAWQLVQDKFIDRDVLDTTEMTYGAIVGMLNALGDEGHTTFLTPEDLEDQRTDMSGKFSGIGAYVNMKDMMPVIVAPFDGSPADKAGVKAGDIILEVDGEDTSGQDLGDIVDRIRGPEGSEVVLVLLRIDGDNTESLEITIIRGEIEIPAVDWAMVPGTDVALLRLNRFSANATDQLQEAYAEIEAAGAEALVFDLRNNPGGLLEQAVKVTSQFLTSGNVLQEEDSLGNRKPYKVLSGGVATEIPMVVLINSGSASSAEIAAGAFQDHERATVVGDTTFGTGTVLEPFMLEDGSALMLGTRQWLTADGRLIRKNGIEPDVPVELSVTADLLSADELEELTVEELLVSEDTQLLKALELLDALPVAETVEEEVDAPSATTND